MSIIRSSFTGLGVRGEGGKWEVSFIQCGLYQRFLHWVRGEGGRCPLFSVAFIRSSFTGLGVRGEG